LLDLATDLDCVARVVPDEGSPLNPEEVEKITMWESADLAELPAEARRH
jgi:hypothetical protein